jgi:hypothetical protein
MPKERALARASVAPHASWWRVVATSVIAGFSVVACPGTLDNPGDFADSGGGGEGGGIRCNLTVADVPNTLFRTSCGTSSCHDATAPAAELDLVTDGVQTRLLDVPSTQCGSFLLIDRTTPESSLIIDKVTNSIPNCGDRMPLGLSGGLPPESIACVREWVDLVVGGGSDGGSDAATDSPGAD